MNRIDDAAARDPFRPRAASASPFPSIAFERARADATASLARGVPRIAIVGPAGVGKSALLIQLARDVAQAGDVAWLQPPATSVPEATTLLVDEIDRLDPITRATLLTRPMTTRMIVAGLDDPDPSDETVSVTLSPLEPHEVGPYVQHRLRHAGVAEDLFDDEAIARLGNAAARVPRVLDVLAGRALFAAKLDEADTVRAVHARQAIEEHAALLAAATTPSDIAPELIDTALVLAADADEDDEMHVAVAAPATASERPREKPLVAERIWTEPSQAPPVRSRAPLFAAVMAGCFLLGAALVLAARASDTADAKQLSAAWQAPLPPQPAHQQPPAQAQPQPPTEADAAYVPMPAALTPPPPRHVERAPADPNGSSGSSSAAVPGAPQRVFVHYRRDDSASEKAANDVAARLREHGFQVAELRPVDLRINQASVRYFFDGDRARSEALEREVDAFVRETGLAPRSALLPMRYYEPKPRPGTLEVWLPSTPEPSR